ncbi:MAG: hypothetical protein ACRBK7_27550 [Acidimicrobiales bacterium]
MSNDNSTADSSQEDVLWKRAAYGLVFGLAAAGVLGFALITVLQPDETFMSRLGLAAYLAFWSGPFIGLSAGVGYHELAKDRASSDSKVPSTKTVDHPGQMATVS